jgi:hypothetical protein
MCAFAFGVRLLSGALQCVLEPRLRDLGVLGGLLDADELEALGTAAIPVVPDPRNGSSTSPPGGVTRRHR